MVFTPTAVHAARRVHETPVRIVDAKDASGVGRIDQLWPFHDSIRLWSLLPLSEW
jgi:hypothetical protein